MKNTVDLTLKRDFMKEHNDLFDSISRHLLFQAIGKRKLLPWRNEIRQIQDDADLAIQFGGLYRESDYNNHKCLIVGTKKDREQFKFNQSIHDNVCERCGKKLQEIPWDKEFGFCKKCYEDLKTDNELQNEKVCWRTFKRVEDIEIRICWKR